MRLMTSGFSVYCGDFFPADMDKWEENTTEDSTIELELKVKCTRNPHAAKDATDPEELYKNSKGMPAPFVHGCLCGVHDALCTADLGCTRSPLLLLIHAVHRSGNNRGTLHLCRVQVLISGVEYKARRNTVILNHVHIVYLPFCRSLGPGRFGNQVQSAALSSSSSLVASTRLFLTRFCVLFWLCFATVLTEHMKWKPLGSQADRVSSLISRNLVAIFWWQVETLLHKFSLECLVLCLGCPVCSMSHPACSQWHSHRQTQTWPGNRSQITCGEGPRARPCQVLTRWYVHVYCRDGNSMCSKSS